MYNPIDFVPDNLRSTIEDASFLRFRWTDAEGKPCNGGNAEALVIGEWSETINNPRVCDSGWHTTSDPLAFWNGVRLWVVECRDFDGGFEDDRACSSSIKPICEVEVANVSDDVLAARLGRTNVDRTAVSAAISANMAYFIGQHFGPNDVTRSIACRIPYDAYRYARDVDKGPHDETRAAACRDAKYAFLYAYNVDKGPRDDTRTVASRDPYWKASYEDSFPVNDP